MNIPSTTKELISQACAAGEYTAQEAQDLTSIWADIKHLQGDNPSEWSRQLKIRSKYAFGAARSDDILSILKRRTQEVKEAQFPHPQQQYQRPQPQQQQLQRQQQQRNFALRRQSNRSPQPTDDDDESPSSSSSASEVDTLHNNDTPHVATPSTSASSMSQQSFQLRFPDHCTPRSTAAADDTNKANNSNHQSQYDNSTDDDQHDQEEEEEDEMDTSADDSNSNSKSKSKSSSPMSCLRMCLTLGIVLQGACVLLMLFKDHVGLGPSTHAPTSGKIVNATKPLQYEDIDPAFVSVIESRRENIAFSTSPDMYCGADVSAFTQLWGNAVVPTLLYGDHTQDPQDSASNVLNETHRHMCVTVAQQLIRDKFMKQHQQQQRHHESEPASGPVDEVPSTSTATVEDDSSNNVGAGADVVDVQEVEVEVQSQGSTTDNKVVVKEPVSFSELAGIKQLTLSPYGTPFTISFDPVSYSTLSTSETLCYELVHSLGAAQAAGLPAAISSETQLIDCIDRVAEALLRNVCAQLSVTEESVPLGQLSPLVKARVEEIKSQQQMMTQAEVEAHTQVFNETQEKQDTTSTTKEKEKETFDPYHVNISLLVANTSYLIPYNLHTSTLLPTAADVCVHTILPRHGGTPPGTPETPGTAGTQQQPPMKLVDCIMSVLNVMVETLTKHTHTHFAAGVTVELQNGKLSDEVMAQVQREMAMTSAQQPQEHQEHQEQQEQQQPAKEQDEQEVHVQEHGDKVPDEKITITQEVPSTSAYQSNDEGISNEVNKNIQKTEEDKQQVEEETESEVEVAHEEAAVDHDQQSLSQDDQQLNQDQNQDETHDENKDVDDVAAVTVPAALVESESSADAAAAAPESEVVEVDQIPSDDETNEIEPSTIHVDPEEQHVEQFVEHVVDHVEPEHDAAENESERLADVMDDGQDNHDANGAESSDTGSTAKLTAPAGDVVETEVGAETPANDEIENRENADGNADADEKYSHEEQQEQVQETEQAQEEEEEEEEEAEVPSTVTRVEEDVRHVEVVVGDSSEAHTQNEEEEEVTHNTEEPVSESESESESESDYVNNDEQVVHHQQEHEQLDEEDDDSSSFHEFQEHNQDHRDEGESIVATPASETEEVAIATDAAATATSESAEEEIAVEGQVEPQESQDDGMNASEERQEDGSDVNNMIHDEHEQPGDDQPTDADAEAQTEAAPAAATAEEEETAVSFVDDEVVLQQHQQQPQQQSQEVEEEEEVVNNIRSAAVDMEEEDQDHDNDDNHFQEFVDEASNLNDNEGQQQPHDDAPTAAAETTEEEPLAVRENENENEETHHAADEQAFMQQHQEEEVEQQEVPEEESASAIVVDDDEDHQDANAAVVNQDEMEPVENEDSSSSSTSGEMSETIDPADNNGNEVAQDAQDTVVEETTAGTQTSELPHDESSGGDGAFVEGEVVFEQQQQEETATATDADDIVSMEGEGHDIADIVTGDHEPTPTDDVTSENNKPEEERQDDQHETASSDSEEQEATSVDSSANQQQQEQQQQQVTADAAPALLKKHTLKLNPHLRQQVQTNRPVEFPDDSRTKRQQQEEEEEADGVFVEDM